MNLYLQGPPGLGMFQAWNSSFLQLENKTVVYYLCIETKMGLYGHPMLVAELLQKFVNYKNIKI